MDYIQVPRQIMEIYKQFIMASGVMFVNSLKSFLSISRRQRSMMV